MAGNRFTHLSTFSGVGGVDVAAHWAGFDTVAFVERDAYCQKILTRHFPGVPIHDDITTFSGHAFRGRLDLLTGGFPCQPFSQAGARQGHKDDRYLWPDLLRVITEAQPTWIVLENVVGILTMDQGIDRVLLDLENQGYQAVPVVLPASAVGASHRRYRVFIIGWNTNSQRCKELTDGKPAWTRDIDGFDAASNPSGSRCTGESRRRPGSLLTDGYTPIQGGHWSTWGVKCVFRRDADGIAPGMDSRSRTNRLKALGNAVVPQQIFPILDAIAKELRKGEQNGRK